MHALRLGMVFIAACSAVEQQRFAAPSRVELAGQTFGMAVADLDGDGYLDIAVNVGTTIVVLANQKDGTFTARTPVDTTQSFGGPLLAADFDGDGHQDLAFASNALPTPPIAVFLGNGDTTFGAPNLYATAPRDTFAADDLNRDHRADLVMSTSSCSMCSGMSGAQIPGAAVLLNAGDGSFEPPLAYAAGTGDDPVRRSKVALADLDGDGWDDIVTIVSAGASDDGGVSVLLNHGDATFATPTPYAASGSPVDVAIADVNGDGKSDVIVRNAPLVAHGYSTLDVYLNRGAGVLEPAMSYSLSADEIGALSGVALGDFRGDGVLDAITLDYNNLFYVENDGAGHFHVSDSFYTFNVTSDVATGDFDNDGNLDIAVAGQSESGSDSEVDVFLQRADGPRATSLPSGSHGDCSAAPGGGAGSWPIIMVLWLRLRRRGSVVCDRVAITARRRAPSRSRGTRSPSACLPRKVLARPRRQLARS